MVTYPTSLDKNDEFINTVNTLVERYNIQDIVETGTGSGSGSTVIFAKTELPIITMECNPMALRSAGENLKKFPNVIIKNALSLKKSILIEFIKTDKWDIPEGIEIDSTNPVSFYTNEVNREVIEEDILFGLINNNRKQLIFLDSAGGVGWLEFIKVMELETNFLHNKVLLLDDVNHVKHYRSIKELDLIGYKVIISKDNRFGYTTFESKE